MFGRNIARRFFSNFSLSDFNKTKFTQLSNRSLLILNGPDCHKYFCLYFRLLQGITTNDIRQLKPITVKGQQTQRISLYTLFLQAKGKVITDGFIFQPRMYSEGKAIYADDELWIDVPK